MINVIGLTKKSVLTLIFRIILIETLLLFSIYLLGLNFDYTAFLESYDVQKYIEINLLLSITILTIEILVLIIVVYQWYVSITPKKTSEILDSLLLEGESEYVEYKQTLRYDIKLSKTNKSIEKAVMKTIAAFANSKGGSLVIGVDDNGNVCGLGYDLETLPKKNIDGFNNHINQLIRGNLGINCIKHVTVSFPKINSNHVCVIDVRPSNKPTYFKDGEEEFFYIRIGNSTQSLTISETTEYINNHVNFS